MSTMDPAMAMTISVDVLVDAYRHGRFLMSHRDGHLYWHDPDPRAVFPLETVHPNRRLQRLIRSGRYRTSFNTAFHEVITACADRDDTWIDHRIVASYEQLHRTGHAQSVETWHRDQLVGGLYGVSIGGAFFAESMFSHMPSAGKVAFHALVDALRRAGYTLLDTQYINPFTAALGAVEVPRSDFRSALAQAASIEPGPLHHA
jgi:leucyl/phenylalanyl-tRNA--protein transferase